MSSLYPSNLDTTSALVVNRQPADYIVPSDHNDLAQAVVALETKVGYGSSVPSAPNQALISTAAGVTSWQTQQDRTDYNVSRTITQSAHGFGIGSLITISGSAYVLARADSASNAEVVGIVGGIVDTNNFILVTNGYVSGMSGLTAGTVYFLSPTTSGVLTPIQPTTAGQISKPVFIANSSTSGYFHNFRGAVVNAEAEIIENLLTVRDVTSNTTTTNLDDLLYVTTGGITVTLHDSTGATSKEYIINNSGLSSITVSAASGQTVGTVTSVTVASDSTLRLVPHGSKWIVV